MPAICRVGVPNIPTTLMSRMVEAAICTDSLPANSVNYWPYDDIREINELIANIDGGTINDEDRKMLKGQAFFFQGLGIFSNGNTLWRCAFGPSSANTG